MKSLAVILTFAATAARAEAPTIEAATATPTGTGWRIEATLAHPDVGWDHYADAWAVEAADGTRLGVRELLHPHVDEQPFTRGLSLDLPDGLARVHLRARCGVDGWSEVTFPLDFAR